jgi:transcriptional regulator with XRE-family HTH domain
MTIASIGRRLEAARAERGLTQRALAARARTAQSLVARIERGRANPTVKTLARLFDAAGFDMVIDLKPRQTAAPLIEARKREVDRTLLRENLAKTPAERVRTLVAMAELFAETRRGVRARSRTS